MFAIWHHAYSLQGCGCLSFKPTSTLLNWYKKVKSCYSSTPLWLHRVWHKVNRGQTIDADFRIKSSGKMWGKFITWLASQMMTLIRLIPFMVGNCVERNDSHWECFLQLWDICSMVCAFEATTGDATHLAWLVEAYLEEFFILYDGPMTPKLHYLVHLPQQILE